MEGGPSSIGEAGRQTAWPDPASTTTAVVGSTIDATWEANVAVHTFVLGPFQPLDVITITSQ